MKKTCITFVFIAIVALAGFVVIYTINKDEDISTTGLSDPKNISYIIDGQEITLKDGTSESEAAPGSASKVKTEYFGNELVTDLDNDGREDTVFLLTQNMGGTGTFFYVVAALNKENGYLGSDGYLLGDRIAPQTTEISQKSGHENVVVVNYADRMPDEPMTAQPSVGKSAYLKLNPVSMQWGVVEPSFEGEANSSDMSLEMKTWTWVSTLYADGRELLPKAADAFTVTFGADGKFSATTDCNSIGGNYTANTNNISFSEVRSTKMYCEGSQEALFISLIEDVEGYHFTSKGELIFEFKHGSGTATFR